MGGLSSVRLSCLRAKIPLQFCNMEAVISLLPFPCLVEGARFATARGCLFRGTCLAFDSIACYLTAYVLVDMFMSIVLLGPQLSIGL